MYTLEYELINSGLNMKLSTKGRYAVTAMMDLAIHDNEGPVTLSDISSCQGISLSYLEQLFSMLRKAGLVQGVRGPGGGYRLGKTPNLTVRLDGTAHRISTMFPVTSKMMTA